MYVNRRITKKLKNNFEYILKGIEWAVNFFKQI